MAKHLNKDDMKSIERGLDKATTLKELSNDLDRDSRRISRHIKITELSKLINEVITNMLININAKV